MAGYELNSCVPWPGGYISFIEFCPNGRLLAVGDGDLSSLHILDRCAGFQPLLSAIAPAKPTALVWETSKTFYLGQGDGRFTYYKVDLRGKKLVEGVTNRSFHTAIPITAMALDADCKTLVVSVGPDVFAFRRISGAGDFRFVANISSRFNFESEPGRPNPFPRAICFAPNNILIVTFCRRNIASTVLEFDDDDCLHPSFQTAKIEYSGLPVLKAITSANEQGIHQLARCWIYSSEFQSGGNEYPFLFINEGAATLSTSAHGVALIKDSITRRKIQLLNHSEVAGQQVSAMAYHVSNGRRSIATAGHGANAAINIWITRGAFSNLRAPSPRGSFRRKGWFAAALIIVLVVVIPMQMGRVPNASEILRTSSRIVLLFMRMCIQVGYIVLVTSEDAVQRLADRLD